MQQVTIGPEFFAKITLDYSDWRLALVREFLQTCMDAPGCKTISVTVGDGGLQHGDTMLVVENDGKPMDRDTLENKLLTLGGSGKNFEGENTGGFVVAKSLLYYCRRHYMIHTGHLLVSGRGTTFEIEEVEAIPGTRITVVLDGDQQAKLREAICHFAALAQWEGTLTLDGKPLRTKVDLNTYRGTPKPEEDSDEERTPDSPWFGRHPEDIPTPDRLKSDVQSRGMKATAAEYGITEAQLLKMVGPEPEQAYQDAIKPKVGNIDAAGNIAIAIATVENYHPSGGKRKKPRSQGRKRKGGNNA